MANERTSGKIPVTDRQCLWVKDDEKGEVTLHVGPTMVSLTASDHVVVDDGQGGFAEDPANKPQKMVELGDDQYAVLSNPLEKPDGDGPGGQKPGPNGLFKQGRNEGRPLRNGTRQMIPGPISFYVRPGQRCEVRDAHELASNQYLLVKVYGEVDKSAPYYQVTVDSARRTKAADGEKGKDGSGEPTDPKAGPKGESADPKAGPTSGGDGLRRGQLVVITGLDTQFYIPPTGVDIVPDTSLDASGAGIGASAARALLAKMGEEESAQNAPRKILAEGVYEQSARRRHRAASAPGGTVMAAMGSSPLGNMEYAMPAIRARTDAPKPVLASDSTASDFAGAAMEEVAEDIAENEAVRKALEQQAKQARLVRNAVVLAEKEYCALIDADGKREIRTGPARVFPGPYDTFQVKGSRNRVYNAYELLPTRALWLRVLATISAADLQKKLPHGFKLEVDPTTKAAKSQYVPGDEILLTGASGFFVPFNEIEVLNPRTGLAVVGNDHDDVFIEAIGIDQKSGIYVRDLETGEVRLVRGKRSYLVDPRKEVHISRTLTADQWNLIVACDAYSCKSSKATGPMTTQWAISVLVPPNTAVLATSAKGQRIIEGPCVELLEYEESLQVLTLSKGTPKSDADTLKTCFLRTMGVRVSDQVTVETADFVKVSVRASYGVTFDKNLKDRWFVHENYVQFLVDHLRSRIRAKCKTMALKDLWPKVAETFRDTILGEKPHGEKGGQRPGLKLEENGVVVSEVEVLTAQIEDQAIGKLLQEAQTSAVTLQIGDRKAQEELASQKLRASVEKEQQALRAEAIDRQAKLDEQARKVKHEATLATVRDGETVEKERLTLSIIRQAEDLKARLERQEQERLAKSEATVKDAEAEAQASKVKAEAEIEAKARLNQLEIALVQARSAATVAEHQAVQRGLIEAMVGLGDRILLSEVAENMGLVSLFKGKDVGTILKEVLGGTRLANGLSKLTEGAQAMLGNGEKNRLVGTT